MPIAPSQQTDLNKITVYDLYFAQVMNALLISDRKDRHGNRYTITNIDDSWLINDAELIVEQMLEERKAWFNPEED